MKSFQTTTSGISRVYPEQKVSELLQGQKEVSPKKMERKKEMGLGLEYLKKLLDYLQSIRHASEVYFRGPIHLKKSLFKYLRFCIKRNLISHKRERVGKCWSSTYLITEKGRMFLEMIK